MITVKYKLQLGECILHHRPIESYDRSSTHELHDHLRTDEKPRKRKWPATESRSHV